MACPQPPAPRPSEATRFGLSASACTPDRGERGWLWPAANRLCLNGREHWPLQACPQVPVRPAAGSTARLKLPANRLPGRPPETRLSSSCPQTARPTNPRKHGPAQAAHKPPARPTPESTARLKPPTNRLPGQPPKARPGSSRPQTACPANPRKHGPAQAAHKPPARPTPESTARLKPPTNRLPGQPPETRLSSGRPQTADRPVAGSAGCRSRRWARPWGCGVRKRLRGGGGRACLCPAKAARAASATSGNRRERRRPRTRVGCVAFGGSGTG
ncbi:hypothetical protein YIM_05565 [Amycolatopsis sp. YIM 10]|nr:hypothetical protein YIM_05565 [Amycolatopsis sp. YIM 10]